MYLTFEDIISQLYEPFIVISYRNVCSLSRDYGFYSHLRNSIGLGYISDKFRYQKKKN